MRMGSSLVPFFTGLCVTMPAPALSFPSLLSPRGGFSSSSSSHTLPPSFLHSTGPFGRVGRGHKLAPIVSPHPSDRPTVPTWYGIYSCGEGRHILMPCKLSAALYVYMMYTVLPVFVCSAYSTETEAPCVTLCAAGHFRNLSNSSSLGLPLTFRKYSTLSLNPSQPSLVSKGIGEIRDGGENST